MIEIERISFSEKWDRVKYQLRTPRPWLQHNFNEMFGLQTHVIQLEINPHWTAIENTKDVIKDLIGLYGKEQAIKELQATVNVIILEAEEAAMGDTK